MVLSVLPAAVGSVGKVNLAKQSGERAKAKEANEPDRVKALEKHDLFPTTATGADASPLLIDPVATRAADYYRNGKFIPGEVPQYEIPPLEFKPIDTREEPASIRIWGRRPKTDTITDIIPPYSKFILESVQEGHTERSQIVETFGDHYVFMFGERPPIYNFAGQLVNSRFTNWVTDFMFLYDRYLRGSKCVEYDAVVILTYGNRQIEGLITSTSNTTTAAVEGAVSFNFTVVVFDRKYIHFSEDMGFSSDDNIALVKDEAFAELLQQVAGPEGVGQSREEVSISMQAANALMKGSDSAVNLKGPTSVDVSSVA